MKTRDAVILDLDPTQWQELENLYSANLDSSKPRGDGIILGQPDLVNGKIKFTVFSWWEHKILYIAFWICSIGKKSKIPSRKHPYAPNKFWLGE